MKFSPWLLMCIGLWSLQSVSGLATMSIDMSSEFFKVAIVKPGVPMEIVLNKESRRKTPAVVAFKDGETLLGDTAMVVSVKKPRQSFAYFLDLLAKDLENPIVQKYMKDFPHHTLAMENGRAHFVYDDDTVYYPEELLAIALNASREMAENYAEQSISDAVITVPAYFNQAERKAVVYAAELCGLRVLQLMSDNSAVALNYGVFRRKEFNASVQHVMFFDMGAGSTVASIVGYQTVKSKEEGSSEIYPQLTIKGVGFDRTLGSKELELTLQAHLAKVFTEKKKTSSSVYDSPRAMAKLLKEAKRVKQVLSANNDHMAQVEGLLDDEDFKAAVTRTDLVKMNEGFFNRIEGVVERALKAADMTMIEIDSVILVGGGTRVPKVQEALLEVTKKKELAKNINADEAAALGSVYQAAELSKGFKVKKFLVKDASIYPIQVEFDKLSTDEDGTEAKRTVRRTLFHRMNVMPQKKVMTFNKHKEDFTLNVNYADLASTMTEQDVGYFGSQNLSTIRLTGVREALSNHTDDDAKGIKAHFRMDESGILHLDSVEAVFERLQNVTVNETEEEEQSTFAKLGDTISRFFSGSSDDEKGGEKAEAGTEGATQEESVTPDDTLDKQSASDGQDTGTEGDTKDEEPGDTKEEEPGDTKEEPVDAKEEREEGEGEQAAKEKGEDEAAGDDQTSAEGEQAKEEADRTEAGEEGSKKGEAKQSEKEGESKEEKKAEEAEKADEVEKPKEEKKKPKKPQLVTVKVPITVEMEVMDCPEPSKESKTASIAKLKDLRKLQDAKRAKEHAVNNLESFIYETREKLYEEEYEACSLEEERDLISSNLSEASDWIYDVDDDANVTVFKQKLRELKKLTKDLFFRVKEKRERPELIEALKSALNTSEVFLDMMKNVTEEDSLFTKVEIELLEKVYNKSKEWFKTKMKAQKKLADHERPVLLVGDLKDKITDLDRELRYLVGKAKTAKPKKKPATEKNANKTTSEKNATETDETEKLQTDLPVDKEETAAEDATTEPSDDTSGDPVGEEAQEEEESLQLEGGENVQGEEPADLSGEADGSLDEPVEEPGEVPVEKGEPLKEPPTDTPDQDSPVTEGTDDVDSTTTEKLTAHNSGDL